MLTRTRSGKGNDQTIEGKESMEWMEGDFRYIDVEKIGSRAQRRDEGGKNVEITDWDWEVSQGMISRYVLKKNPRGKRIKGYYEKR